MTSVWKPHEYWGFSRPVELRLPTGWSGVFSFLERCRVLGPVTISNHRTSADNGDPSNNLGPDPDTMRLPVCDQDQPSKDARKNESRSGASHLHDYLPCANLFRAEDV